MTGIITRCARIYLYTVCSGQWTRVHLSIIFSPLLFGFPHSKGAKHFDNFRNNQSNISLSASASVLDTNHSVSNISHRMQFSVLEAHEIQNTFSIVAVDGTINIFAPVNSSTFRMDHCSKSIAKWMCVYRKKTQLSKTIKHIEIKGDDDDSDWELCWGWSFPVLFCCFYSFRFRWTRNHWNLSMKIRFSFCVFDAAQLSTAQMKLKE